MACALAKQQPTKRHALARRPQTSVLQHFVDVVPGTAGQSRLAPNRMGPGTGGFFIRNWTVVAHFHFGHCKTTALLSPRYIRRNSLRCKFFATGIGRGLSATARGSGYLPLVLCHSQGL